MEGSLPTVTQVLADRRSGSTDDHTVALAVEGGGMRGVISGSMLIALRDLGLVGVFDRFYGISSGALNLTYLAAGGGWDALSVYYDHLTRRFVRRMPGPGRPLVDMSRLEQVIRTEVPLDTAAVRASSLDVRMVLSDVAARRPVVVATRDTGESLIEHLLAGSWLPILAGPPFILGGRQYLDGGLLWPSPVYAALHEGVTHVLLLSTSPDGGPMSLTGLSTTLLGRVLDRWSPGLGTTFQEGNERWTRDNGRMPAGRTVRIGDVRIHRIRPPAGAHGVGRLTLDRSTLLDGARCGYATVMEAFGRQLDDGGYFAVVG